MPDKLIVGCGYLGRRVAARWLEQGHRVYGTTRSNARAEELAKLGIEPVVCDVLLEDSLKRLPHLNNVVYCVGFDRSRGMSMAEVYVRGLRNFIESLREDPEHFVYISSTGVYGQCGGEAVDEEAQTVPPEQSGQIVLEAEKLIRQWWFNGWSSILRFAGIYGPGRVIRRQAIEQGEAIIGDADKWLNLIHVEDGVTAILAAEASNRPILVYNVVDNQPVCRRDFYAELARLLGAPGPRFVAPDPDGPLPPHEQANRRILNRRMREELGVSLQYPSYREGLRACGLP